MPGVELGGWGLPCLQGNLIPTLPFLNAGERRPFTGCPAIPQVAEPFDVYRFVEAKRRAEGLVESRARRGDGGLLR